MAKIEEAKTKQVGFRITHEIEGFLDKIAESIFRRTGIRPSRTQVFELAVRQLAKAEKVVR